MIRVVFYYSLMFLEVRALARISELGIHIFLMGELGVQFLFIPLHYTQKIWILAMGCPTKGHTDTPLAKCLL